MSNWCLNYAKISHKNQECINMLIRAYKSGKTMGTFCPEPHETNEDNCYSWRFENWGTKWDFGDDEGYSSELVMIDDHTVKIFFDTAWSPPIQFYRHLESKGFEVDAYYYEPGLCFYGQYKDGQQDGSLYNTFKDIPQNIVDIFDIIDWNNYENV